ncbi:MAG: HU family DNA-binding protein [Pseudomonadota bacterium]
MLINLIYEKIKSTDSNVMRKTVELVCDTFIQTIRESLIKGNPVYLMKFGHFNLKKISGREINLVQNNKKMFIPASTSVKFTPSDSWKKDIKSNNPVS